MANWWNPFEVGASIGSAIGNGVAGITSSAVEAQNNYNADQAQLQRDWEERMSNSAYQRAVADLNAAGLNPWLAVQNGGIGASTPSGAAASSNTASAQIHGYTGVINTSLNGIARVASSALQIMGNLGSAVIRAVGSGK